MLTTIEGTYREGKVELEEPPSDMEGARVLVTFLREKRTESPGGGERERREKKWHWEESRAALAGIQGSVSEELRRQRDME